MPGDQSVISAISMSTGTYLRYGTVLRYLQYGTVAAWDNMPSQKNNSTIELVCRIENAMEIHV